MDLRALAAPDNPYRELLVQPAADQLLADVRELLDGAGLVAGLATMDLHQFHVVLVNSSAGKDSQAMLAYLVALADAQGYPRNRLIVVHADLGRVEWEGTRELAEAQAKAYGLRFEVVEREEDLLDHVVTRRANLDAAAEVLELEACALWYAGVHQFAELAWADARKRRATPAWPSSTARWCTSDHKTSQVSKLMTRLVDEWRGAGGEGAMRILNTLGIRAAESPARAKKEPLGADSASNTKREVTRWLPIFEWSDQQVWDTIRASGLPWHPAYDAGMPRLSCAFCVLAGRRELVLAARLNPGLAREYIAVEDQVGHTFKNKMSVREIAREAEIEEIAA